METIAHGEKEKVNFWVLKQYGMKRNENKKGT